MKIFSKLLPASKMKLVISSIGVLALLVFSSMMIFEATKAEVIVTENGKEQTVTTHSDTVEELLEEVGISVGEHDALSHDETAQVETGMEIEYKTAKEVTVTIDDKEEDYFTTMDTIEQFLKEQNLTLSEYDEVSHQTDESIKNGLQLDIAKAYQVTINDGGNKEQVWTTGGSIEDILQQNDITYDENLDKIKPAIDEEVTKDEPIVITRVQKEIDEVEETVAFSTERKNDNSLEKGKEKVVTQGRNGTIVKKYEIVKENGEEVSRELINEEVIQESQNKVVAVGTKVEQKELVTLSSDSSKSSSKEMTMTASAYTAGCSGCSGYTSTGINLNANPDMKVIAVDPSVIPLGTRVWVEGYGEAVAGDTGGSIKGHRIDVHVPTKSDAYRFGVRKVKVKILD
ncbi:ubiquitin-like domain-containing protein [Virgibacillus byunsanensis]|uniref:Ubiquitin-like domain-containing protein n=1 Tax=Virgibacillus byunsanensis TaxID=570945 RepID=A0ABW3LSA6_9BACI